VRQFNFKSKSKKDLLYGKSIPPPQKTQYLLFSFKDLDRSQGGTFKDWQRKMILADACDKLHSYSLQTVPQCFSDKFKSYKRWPEHSNFKKPKHVPEDAVWYSMHISAKLCLGGHLVHNIFYIVFLDENHDLWPSKRK